MPHRGPVFIVEGMMRPLATAGFWVFDLDNTLYPASCDLFSAISRRIGQFIAERFGLSADDAREMQRRLYRTHGTTLRGLMVEHDIDPVPFLEFVHDVDMTPIPPSPDLDRALGALPGRKVVFTNGSRRHAERVLARLGVARRIDGVFDIVDAGYRPKPDPDPYRVLIERHGIDPACAVMVEDIARNLVPAHALGMTTVWVRCGGPPDQETGTGSHIDVTIDELVPWLSGLTPES